MRIRSTYCHSAGNTSALQGPGLPIMAIYFRLAAAVSSVQSLLQFRSFSCAGETKVKAEKIDSTTEPTLCSKPVVPG